MKSMFDIGFRKAFMPLSGSRSTLRLGQESDWGSGWEPEWEPDGGIFTSYDQGTATEIPNLYTSIDQDLRPVSDIPGLVTQRDAESWGLPSSSPSSSTDWSKFAQELVKGAGAGFGSYQQAQAKFNTERAKAGLPAVPLATAAAAGSSGISPNVIFLVGGLAVAVLAAVALS